MSNIRELSLEEITLISGGESHEVRDAANARARGGSLTQAHAYNGPTHIYSNPSTVACANQAFGAITSLPNVGRTAARMVGAAAQCLDLHAGSGQGGNAGSAKCSGNSAADTCNRP